LNSLEINGALTFLPGGNRKLSAYKIWVRAGTLNIGSELLPWDKDEIAEIELLGDNIYGYWSFASAIEAGNKNLVITGTVNMYGFPRFNNGRQRLLKSIYVGQDTPQNGPN
jgi:hypothetical protein